MKPKLACGPVCWYVASTDEAKQTGVTNLKPMKQVQADDYLSLLQVCWNLSQAVRSYEYDYRTELPEKLSRRVAEADKQISASLVLLRSLDIPMDKLFSEREVAK